MLQKFTSKFADDHETAFPARRDTEAETLTCVMDPPTLYHIATMASRLIATASSEKCLDGTIVDCDDTEAQASTMTENVDRVETAPSGDEITASIPTSGRSPPIHPPCQSCRSLKMRCQVRRNQSKCDRCLSQKCSCLFEATTVEPRTPPMRTPGACRSCKKLKVQCVFGRGEVDCERCIENDCECVVEGRKPRCGSISSELNEDGHPPLYSGFSVNYEMVVPQGRLVYQVKGNERPRPLK